MIITVVFLAIALTLFITYKFTKITNIYIKAILKYLFLSIIIAISIENMVFNYRHFESILFANEEKIESYDLVGFKEEDGFLSLDSPEPYIEIKNIDKGISNICIDIRSRNKDLIFTEKISFTDEANKLYLDAGIRTYAEEIEKTHYSKINSSGKIGNIKITLYNVKFDFKIYGIYINKIVPIDVKLSRVILILSILFSLMCILTKSVMHNLKYNCDISTSVSMILIAIFSLLSYKFITYNTNFHIEDKENCEYTYQNLAKSLANFRLDIDFEVPDKLEELEKPYDTFYRKSVFNDDSTYHWDYAYYKGKYYVYFGIVPCLLFYLPYYLIFGSHISNSVVLGITIFIFLVSIFYLLRKVCNYKFKNTSMPMYNFMCIFTFFASSIIVAIKRPEFYNIPIILGISFAMFGLGLWIHSKEKEGKKKVIYLMLGSLFMALVIGCRPNIILSALLVIPIFYDEIFVRRTLFSKSSIKETVLFILPFVIIGVLQMIYNYLRFNSFFDFGATYNLTTEDMTRRSIKIDRNLSGLFSYLFETTRITTVFPFIETYISETSYIGRTVREYMCGGYFFQNLICIVSLIPFLFKKVLKENKVYMLSIVLMGIALLIVLVDIQMVGIINRYFLDFGWLFSICTVIILFSLTEKYKSEELKILIISLILMSILVNCLVYLSESTIFIGSNLLKEKFIDFIAFWL